MTNDHVSDQVDQWLVASDGEPAEQPTAFLVHLKEADKPVRVEARYTCPEDGWLMFMRHDHDDVYPPDDVVVERVAAFPTENVLYVERAS